MSPNQSEMDGHLFDVSYSHYFQFVGADGKLDHAAVLDGGYNERQIPAIEEMLNQPQIREALNRHLSERAPGQETAPAEAAPASTAETESVGRSLPEAELEPE